MKPLTRSQRKIFDFVSSFLQEKGYSPTFRDIQTHFGFASLGSVYSYITHLKKKGVLQDTKRGPIALPSEEKNNKQPSSDVSLPFIGYISAGFPIETFPQTQTLTVPPALVVHPDDTYVLRAKGDTLIEEHILDGDLLIVEARNEATNGELIVATLNQSDTIIKRYFSEDNYIRLESSSLRHEPIILEMDEIAIQGVVIGLMRSYSA